MDTDEKFCVHPCSSVVSILLLETEKALIPMSCDRFLPFNAASSTDAPIAGAVRCGARVFLSGRSALQPDGKVAGLGDAAAQTDAALDSIEVALQAAGGSLSDITKLTTSLVDRAHRKPVYEAIGRRLRDVFPVSTGLLVAGLSLPELMVQIDAEAVVAPPVRRLRTFEMKHWFGQDITWQGAMAAAAKRSCSCAARPVRRWTAASWRDPDAGPRTPRHRPISP